MGETVDQYGKHHVLVVPDVSVFDPDMSDSLISAGRLMEADYKSFSESHQTQPAMASLLRDFRIMVEPPQIVQPLLLWNM